MDTATLVYDDDCGFCTWWAEFFADRTETDIVGFSALTPSLRARLPAGYERCSHLLTDEARYSCGASIEEAALHTSAGSALRPLVEALRTVELYGAVREWGYRRFAGNRSFWGTLLSKTPPLRRADEETATEKPQTGVE